MFQTNLEKNFLLSLIHSVLDKTSKNKINSTELFTFGLQAVVTAFDTTLWSTFKSLK